MLIPHYRAFEPLSLDENVGSVANKAWLIPVRPRPCLCCTPVRPSRHPMRQREARLVKHVCVQV